MSNDRIMLNDSLELDIYTIGFNGIGESNLVLIKVDSIVHLSFLIDYYSKSTSNEMEEILIKNNIKYLDYVIWTHPHADHTKGLYNILENYTNKETEVIIPGYLFLRDIGDRTNEQKKIIKELKCLNNKEKKDSNFKFKLCRVVGSMVLIEKVYTRLYQEFYFRFDILTPSIDLLEDELQFNDENEVNNYSIACNFRINDRNFIFAGDILNKSIDDVRENLLPGYNGIEFLKVPHHGSESSLNILNWLHKERNIGTSIITQYSNSGIPRRNCIEKYSAASDSIFYINNKGSSQFGLYNGKFDIIRESVKDELNGNVYDVSYISRVV